MWTAWSAACWCPVARCPSFGEQERQGGCRGRVPSEDVATRGCGQQPLLQSDCGPSCNRALVAPPSKRTSDRRERGDDDLLDGEHPDEHDDAGGELVADQGTR